MKLLITGITGLIGKHLLDVLVKKKEVASIRGQYISNRNMDDYLAKGVELFQADICDEKALQNITKDCAIVVHSAAKVIDFGTKEEFYTAHYDATHFLLKDALKNNVKQFIYISSFGVASGIDRTKIIPDENTPLIKTGIHYDDAKIDTEKLVKDFCIQNKISYTIIRPAAVIGVGSVWVVEPIKRMQTKLGLKLIDNGKHPACLIDATNLANGIYLCINNPKADNQTYFFMDDWDISWSQYLTEIATFKNTKLAGSIPFKIAFPLATFAEWIFPKFGKSPPLSKKAVKATGSNRMVNTTKANVELGWKSVITYSESMLKIKNSLR